MAIALGCIADDYTGASDLANTLSRQGLRTVQTIGVPDDDLDLPEADAIVVSLKIRSVAAALAVERARAADRWLRARGAGHVIYKVCSTFDSTDAGNIGPVLDALRADVDESTVIVTPAFPETGRTVYQGNLFVGSVPLNESSLRTHPLNPMHDANLVRVLARQSAAKVGLIDLATVSRGLGAVRERLAQLAEEGAGSAIADAVFDADLESLGAAALERRLSIGASGLGLGLARAVIATGAAQRHEAGISPRPVGGPAACLAGSCSRATLEQIACAERSMPVHRLDPEKLIGGTGEVGRALDWAVLRMNDGPFLVASSGTPEAVADLQARHGRETVGHAIEQALASVAEGLIAHGVRRLVVAGGETSGAVVDRLGIAAFEIGAEIAPGVPVLRTLGAVRAGMVLALKSGNFGSETFFTDALARMP